MSAEKLTGVLIDPIKKEITDVELGKELQDIYDLIDCDCFCLVRIGRADWMYLDDMGSFRDEQYFWICELYPSPHPLINKALVLGDGESATYNAETLRPLVHFPVEVQ